MGGDGGCRVGEVRAGTTSPMPDHKGFKPQQLVNFQKFSTLKVNCNKTQHILYKNCLLIGTAKTHGRFVKHCRDEIAIIKLHIMSRVFLHRILKINN